MTTHISIDSKSIEQDIIEIQSRSMPDPTFSDIDLKNKMAWVGTTLNLERFYGDFQETDTFGIETEFMVGDSLLISAVMEEGKREVETYFPPGNWFRLDDHENVYKNNMIVSAGEEEQVPTFIRGGTSFAVRDRIRRSRYVRADS